MEKFLLLIASSSTILSSWFCFVLYLFCIFFCLYGFLFKTFYIKNVTTSTNFLFKLFLLFSLIFSIKGFVAELYVLVKFIIYNYNAIPSSTLLYSLGVII